MKCETHSDLFLFATSFSWWLEGLQVAVQPASQLSNHEPWALAHADLRMARTPCTTNVRALRMFVLYERPHTTDVRVG